MSQYAPNQIRDHIYTFIKSHGILTLATQSPDGPWVATLYYGLDEHLNLFVLTDPDSIHGQHMAANSQVAFNIFDSHQKISKPKLGVQGKGSVHLITGLAANTRALMRWHRQNPGIATKITIKDVKKYADTKLYQITPTFIKFFNKQLYSPNDHATWEPLPSNIQK